MKKSAINQKLENLSIFSGTSSLSLGKEICNHLEIPLGNAVIKKFSDGEIFVKLLESVRKKETFVIQSIYKPSEYYLLELLIFIDALKRASAGEITAVIPYYGYARQDRKVEGRTPISAKLLANLLVTAGAHRVICMDLHSGQIQGFFDIPLDNLSPEIVLLDYVSQNFNLCDLVIVSPDAGGQNRARQFIKKLMKAKNLKNDIPMAIIDKQHGTLKKSKPMSIIGSVRGKRVLILDDIVDTATTLTKGARLLLKKGAIDVTAFATHPVLSGPAIGNLRNSGIKKVVVTDTIPLNNRAVESKMFHVLHVGKIFGEALKQVHLGGSVSDIFLNGLSF